MNKHLSATILLMTLLFCLGGIVVFAGGYIRHVPSLIVILGAICALLIILLLAKRARQTIHAAKVQQNHVQQHMVEVGKMAAIGELTAGIAHEINSPLAIMMENAGWVQDILDSEDFQSAENMAEMRASLQTIVTQGHRCREITHRLLNFARSNSQADQNVDLNALLTDIAGFLFHKARQREVEIRLLLEPNAGWIKGSITEVQQIVLNLMNNAIDAIGQGPGVVVVRSQREGHFVHLEIEDSGQGIAPDVLPHIFEPFFTTKPAGQGTGLGLAICREIVDRMHGQMSVVSLPEHGTTFHVRLPTKEP